jgi:HK97 gp10 family phage protein
MTKTWTQRGGYKSYGETALGHGFQVSGIDEYLKKIEALGKSIDDAAIEAANESVKPILHDMKQGESIHYDTGIVYNAIEAQPAIKDVNVISAFVGIDLKMHPNAKHAVFQEYGDGHTPGFPDPFIRPAFDNNKKECKSIQRKVLKRWGIPTNG